MTSLAVRGGTALSPHGWADVDVVLRAGRIVTPAPGVDSGGETVDGSGGRGAWATGGAGAERVARTTVVDGDAAPAAGPDNPAAGDDAAHGDVPGGRAGPAAPSVSGAADRVLDATGRRVVPGLVDLQCNGGFGIDLTAEPERLWELAALLPRTGVTAWLPTIVTGPPSVRERALAALRAGPPPSVAEAEPLAWPLGLHLEGPFLATERRGAHPGRWLRVPSDDDAVGWSRAAGVALVTLAPELPGAPDLVRRLVGAGVVVAAGHSSATAAEAGEAIDAGVSYVTHLFNAMAPLHHREPGLAGVALTDERVRVGVIADGLHLDRRAVALAAMALGDRLTLVTDAVAALGLPPGPTTIGGTAAVAAGGGVRLADGTLAGSALALDEAVRNLCAFAGTEPAAGVRAATSVPAAVLGLDDRGVIAPGAVGDLVVLDEAGRVDVTVIGGEIAYDRGRTGADTT